MKHPRRYECPYCKNIFLASKPSKFGFVNCAYCKRDVNITDVKNFFSMNSDGMLVKYTAKHKKIKKLIDYYKRRITFLTLKKRIK